MPKREPPGAGTGRGAGRSVLRAVSVDRRLSASTGRQLERQLAVMVREGRLEPGRRLPSTRRLARVVGVHRNTVAAAYRRLAGRALLELRHGARARVCSVAAGGGSGEGEGVLAAAADGGTARLLAAEVRDALPAGVDVGPLVVDDSTRFGPGDGPAPAGAPRDRLVAALPGAALRRMAGGSDIEPRGRVLRVLQDRRERIRHALLRVPPLAVVVVATGCPLVREAVVTDAARLRGPELSVRPSRGRSLRRQLEGGGSAPAGDLVIADRLAADAFCAPRPIPSGPEVVRARLLSRDSLAALVDAVAGTGEETVRA